MSKQTYAHSYDTQESNPDLAHHWRTLAQECNQLATQLRELYTITEVTIDKPYATSQAMFDALERGEFAVSTTNCVHPVFTPSENVNWRIIHDILGHFSARAGFSWAGEQAAHDSQAHWHSASARIALRTEILGQTASYSINKVFPTQKLVLV